MRNHKVQITVLTCLLCLGVFWGIKEFIPKPEPFNANADECRYVIARLKPKTNITAFDEVVLQRKWQVPEYHLTIRSNGQGEYKKYKNDPPVIFRVQAAELEKLITAINDANFFAMPEKNETPPNEFNFKAANCIYSDCSDGVETLFKITAHEKEKSVLETCRPRGGMNALAMAIYDVAVEHNIPGALEQRYFIELDRNKADVWLHKRVETGDIAAKKFLDSMSR